MTTCREFMRRGAGMLAGAAVALCATGAAAGELDDLRARNEALSARLNALSHEVENLKALSAAAANRPAAALKPAVRSGNDKLTLSLSGQVNRAVLGYDDGVETGIHHVDNSNSSTRFRFVGAGHLDEDISAGTVMEIELRSNPSSRVTQGQTAPVGDTSFNKRVVELFFQSKRFGRVSLGHGSTASDGVSEADLSGTSVIAKSAIQDFAGGLRFRDGTSGALSTVRLSNAFSHFNGLGRDERLRYDSPNFGGFQGAVSSVDGGAADAAISFGGAVMGTKLRAAVGYGNASSRQGYTRTSGSVSALLPIGVSLTVAAGKQANDGSDDGRFAYGKLGYQAKLWSIGKTAFAVDAYRGDDIRTAGETSTAYGAHAVQNIDKLATELYLGYRHHELDAPGVTHEPIRAVLGGARVRF